MASRIMHFRFIQATYILFVEAELARRMKGVEAGYPLDIQET
jgi:hypothetical protein